MIVEIKQPHIIPFAVLSGSSSSIFPIPFIYILPQLKAKVNKKEAELTASYRFILN
jgi:hypothetical protein